MTVFSNVELGVVEMRAHQQRLDRISPKIHCTGWMSSGQWVLQALHNCLLYCIAGLI